jgi:hypothetical protein
MDNGSARRRLVGMHSQLRPSDCRCGRAISAVPAAAAEEAAVDIDIDEQGCALVRLTDAKRRNPLTLPVLQRLRDFLNGLSGRQDEVKVPSHGAWASPDRTYS